MPAKFVIFKDLSTGKEHAVLFPGTLNHCDVASVMSRYEDTMDKPRDRNMMVPVSAGFVEITTNTLTPYGRSESLQMSPRKVGTADQDALNKLL